MILILPKDGATLLTSVEGRKKKCFLERGILSVPGTVKQQFKKESEGETQKKLRRRNIHATTQNLGADRGIRIKETAVIFIQKKKAFQTRRRTQPGGERP